MSLHVEIEKRLAHFKLEIAIDAGREWVGVLGASGCGKSMTLKCIAGIVQPDKGRIVVNGQTLFDSAKGINLGPQQRQAGYLFQNYALFPTMSVRDNLGIVLRHRKSAERKALVAQMLERLHLGNLADRLPGQLSGGQQQRVALARILVMDPGIVMLDEPFSALDQYLRNQIEAELRGMLQDYGGTVLFVSHNRDEVYRLCQRMEVLEQGKVVASGLTEELFRDPRSVAAAQLTGCKNIARAQKIGHQRVAVPAWGLELDTAVPVPDDLHSVGIRAHLIAPVENLALPNSFHFRTSSFASTPFSHAEILWPANSPKPPQTPLHREISVNDVASVSQTSLSVEQAYRLPPECLLLLRHP